MSEEQLKALIQQANQVGPGGQFTAHYGSYLDYQMLAAKTAPSYYLRELRFPWSEDEPEGGQYILNELDKDMGNPLRPMGTKSLEEYRQEGYQYFIVNSYRYGSYFKPGSERSKNFPSFHRFYNDLFSQAKLVKEFNPTVEGRPGPTIKIFYLSPEEHQEQTEPR